MIGFKAPSGRFAVAGLAVTAALMLSGCQPGAMGLNGPVPGVVQPVVEPAETAYLSRSDNGFTIPAVPLAKLPEGYRRQVVAYPNAQTPGTIVINPGQKFLYFVTGPNTAIRYGISVGRAGFEWAGRAQVAETKVWPTWTPPKEMIARDPKLAKWADGEPGGPSNPLGARAIYLKSDGRDYGYRIHGTPDWWTIGKNASSGCIRMIHQDVIDLNSRIQTGADVIVLNADGTMPTGLKLPPPAPVKAKATPKPKAAPAVATEADKALDPDLAKMKLEAPVTGAETTGPAADPVVTPATPAPAPAISVMPTAPAAPTDTTETAPVVVAPNP